MSHGRLIVCATPIGNLGDISDRLRNTLASADLVFAEDTRRTQKLLSHLGVSVPVVSLFVGNETKRVDQVVGAVADGQKVVLVSDAGMPTVSDPGSKAVAAVREAGLPVSVVPGPSAVTAAIAVSGFGGDSFVFEGFLPRRGKERKDVMRSIAAEPRTVVFFASPNRLGADLADLASAGIADRDVAVTRELTKLHEEVWVGTLAEAAEHWHQPARGEVTVVLAPRTAKAPSLEDAISSARRRVKSGATVSEAARQEAEAAGVSRRAIYEALISDQEPS